MNRKEKHSHFLFAVKPYYSPYIDSYFSKNTREMTSIIIPIHVTERSFNIIKRTKRKASV